jgi:hypothetical protein
MGKQKPQNYNLVKWFEIIIYGFESLIITRDKVDAFERINNMNIFYGLQIPFFEEISNYVLGFLN